MTLPFVCVFVAFVLCHVPKAAASIAAVPAEPSKVSSSAKKRPREKPRGWRARAFEAHRDAVETFGPFAAGVVVAHLAGLDSYRATLLAVTFVVARSLVLATTLAGLDYLRIVGWSVGFLSTAMLYLLPWLV
jgi:uncharacterized MAPEG superfamily protein